MKRFTVNSAELGNGAPKLHRARSAAMSCRRKGGTASGPAASDLDDRELSKAAQLRVEKKSQQPPAAAAGAPPLPLAPFAFVLVCLFVAMYLTVKYSG